MDTSEFDDLLEELTGAESETATAESGAARAEAVSRIGRDDRHPISWVLIGAAVGVLGVMLGAVGVLVIQAVTEDGTTAVAGENAEPELNAVATTVAALGAVSSEQPGASETAPAVESTTTASVMESAPVTADNPAGAIRYLVIEGGEIHVRGLASDRQVANNLVASVASWSRTALLDEMTIDPAAPIETPVAVYVRDQVEFGSGQSTIPAEELPDLDPVLRLLVANPSLTVRLNTWVEGGSQLDEADIEHRLVIERAAAVTDHLVSGGVGAERVATDIGDEADLAELPEYDPDRVIELIVEGTFPG